MNTNEITQHTQQPTLPFSNGETPKDVAPVRESEPANIAELRAENEKLKESLRLRDAHDTLKQKLKKAGARTPKLLLEAAKHALRFTADGMLENAHEVIDDLRDRFPEQFGRDIYRDPHMSIDAGSGRDSKPTLTREALAKMKPEQIAKLDWSDVRRVLSGS
jgi:hypothetical protein